MKAIEFTGDLGEFLSRYEYQPVLTRRLDNLGEVDFTQSLIHEIVLWKVARYVSLNDELLQELNRLKTISTGEHRQAESVLIALIYAHGVDLQWLQLFFVSVIPKFFRSLIVMLIVPFTAENSHFPQPAQ